MKLIWKFNLVLLGIFLVGFAIAGYVSYNVLQKNAREEVLQHARLMMEAALASRTYTNTQVKPLLETQLKYVFLPQTVPAYAATEQFNDVRKTHQDYAYKEATLNPTNPRDRASDWEADVVQIFRQTPDHDRGDRRARHAHRTLALPRPPDPDQERRVPRLPQHGGGRAQDDAGYLRRRQRLRLEDERNHRRAGGVGADDGAHRARECDVPDVHDFAGGRVSRDLRAAQRDAAHDRHPARHPPGGDRRPGEPRQPRGRRIQDRAARTRSAC